MGLMAVAACGYSFNSPVPEHLNTVYVQTFDNQTREFQITQDLTERVINQFITQSRLRLVGSEEEADLLVRGTILDYEEQALSYDPGEQLDPEVFSRRVTLTVDITMDDQVEERVLWENSSLREWGEFSEDQGETVDVGIDRAVQKIAEAVLRNVVEEF